MTHFISYLFGTSYSGLSPAANVAAAVCTINGQPTSCGAVGAFLGASLGVFIAFFAVFLLVIVSCWKIYQKAGQPGWASIVPVYNIVVLLHIVKKPTWWVLLMFVPFVNIIVGLIIVHNLSKVFGHGFGYTLGLIFLPFIFYPMLAFGKSVYVLMKTPMDQGMGMPSANSGMMS